MNDSDFTAMTKEIYLIREYSPLRYLPDPDIEGHICYDLDLLRVEFNQPHLEAFITRNGGATDVQAIFYVKGE